jgi:putative transposase
MKEWLTAREIAAETLPDMPTTKSSVIRYADRLNWNSHPYARPREGRGGGMEYHYRLLPLVAHMAYLQKHGVIGAETAPDVVEMQAESSASLTDRARSERDARLAVLAAFDDFLKGVKVKGRPLTTALFHFTMNYNSRSLHVEEWVRKHVPSISPRSLMRWRAEVKKGIDNLAVDRSKARAGTGLLDTANDGEVRAFILAWIASNPALSADIIMGYCKDHFGDELIDRNGVCKPLPPLRTFQHFIKELRASEKVVLTKITNPDKFRSTMKLSGTGTYRHIDEPNALWMIDASPVDALCLDGRHSLYACIDIATRRLVITLSKTPRASAVGLLVRKTTLLWGVAQVIKTDNGSDFVAIATKRLFRSLNIEMDISDAYSPEQKGHVERVIKTFQHEVGPQLPGYVGHSVADRKAIEDRKSFSARLGADERELFEVALTADQLQRHIDDWLMYRYQEREHGGLKGRTPNAVAAASTAPIRRVDERAMDALLMPVAGKNGLRKMTKQGIKIDGFYYLTGSIMVGSEVFVRMDPLDMGKVYVFDAEDGRYLDVALCPELSDINPQAYVKAQKEISADLIRQKEREIKADIRALKKGPSGIERTIRLAKREFEEREAKKANVIQLPKREEQHTTPQIEAALDAVTVPPAGKVIKPLNEKAAEIHAAIVREAENRKASKVIHLDPDAALSDDARMFKWALSVEAQIASGAAVDDAVAVKLVRCQSSSDYQTRRDIMGDFGLEAALRG